MASGLISEISLCWKTVPLVGAVLRILGRRRSKWKIHLELWEVWGRLQHRMFYKMLIEHTVAEKDQDHIDVLIFGHATMPDRTAAILSGNLKPVYEKLRADLETLAAYGCKAIAVPCNTSHYFLDRIEEDISVPIINMIRESAEEAAKNLQRLSRGDFSDGWNSKIRTVSKSAY